MSLLAADRGEVIASSNLEDISKLHEGQPFFSEGLKDVFIQVVYQNSPGTDPRAVISAPVRGMNGETIGVLVGWMRMNDLNKILSQPAQHQTTETYLVDQSLLFLTQPMLADKPLESDSCASPWTSPTATMKIGTAPVIRGDSSEMKSHCPLVSSPSPTFGRR